MECSIKSKVIYPLHKKKTSIFAIVKTQRYEIVPKNIEKAT